ncbi:MAG TPA: hypothetical protein VN088_05825 [Nocardioides sp.]|nr:hypothetical protein [Nocardioides sp.]
MIPLHLGALHPYERVLVLVFAIGPFVILGIAIWIRARQDRAAALAEEQATAAPEEPEGPTG